MKMENNILNKEMVTELMEILECKRYYSKCLKDVTELKEKMKYEATGIEMRFYYFGKGSGMACLWDKFRYTEDAVPEKSVNRI